MFSEEEVALVTQVGGEHLTPGNLVLCAASQRLSYINRVENHIKICASPVKVIHQLFMYRGGGQHRFAASI